MKGKRTIILELLALPLLCFLTNILISGYAVAAISDSSTADQRVIGYVQQEKPGEIIIVSLVQTGEKAVAVVHDFRKGHAEETHSIPKSVFDEIWLVLSGAKASAYVVQLKKSDNVSDVGFYNVILVGPELQVSLRIPRDSCPKPISAIIDKIKSFIGTE